MHACASLDYSRYNRKPIYTYTMKGVHEINSIKNMSHSSFVIGRPRLLPLESIGDGYGNRTPTRKVVCCCPWSGSGSGSSSNTNKKRILYTSHTSPKKKTGSTARIRPPLPPGPTPLHLIRRLLLNMIRSLPYHYAFTDLARTYGPLLHFKVGRIRFVVASSPEIAEHVLKTHDVACANRPRTIVSNVMSYGNRDIFTPPYGEYWKQMRHVCIAELLSPKNVRSFDYIRRNEGSVLVESVRSSAGAPLDLTEKIISFMNSVTCRTVFGNASMDRAKTIRLIGETLAVGTDVGVADLFPTNRFLNRISWSRERFLKQRWEMDDILDCLIDEHRKNLAATGKGYGESGSEDFVDVLFRLEKSGELRFPITDDAIKAVIGDLFAGGTETTSAAVAWTMAELVRNPRVMAKVQAEIREAFHGKKTREESEIRKLSYLKMVVKESMRLHPPNALIVRACGEDIEIDGYTIPKDSAIVVNLWWLGRDPENWREPEKFEPERFEGSSVDFLGNHFEYIPFGSGKRRCPGISFAVANVEFLLAHLLYCFNWKLPLGIEAEELDMMECNGFSSSRKSGLTLIATPFASAFESSFS